MELTKLFQCSSLPFLAKLLETVVNNVLLTKLVTVHYINFIYVMDELCCHSCNNGIIFNRVVNSHHVVAVLKVCEAISLRFPSFTGRSSEFDWWFHVRGRCVDTNLKVSLVTMVGLG